MDFREPSGESADVLILGGGVAGLSLACQLRAADPRLEIIVIEKAAFPMTEAAHKVGESTVPVAAHYFYDTIGLREQLDEEHIPKFGLRFFGSAHGNRDIAQRPELGARRHSPLRSYQLDKGRLENTLAKRASDAGVAILDGARVTEVSLGDPVHEVAVTARDNTERSLSARWLVDASGRAAILKHKLGLTLEPTHTGQAAWFRIADRISVDDWSSDSEWQSRVYEPARWRSTVHLHGHGYWAWLIPLGSGSTSVGLVTDPDIVPFDRMRRIDPLLDWMRENEPQLAAEVEKRTHLLQDFKTRKDYPRNSSQVFSPDRWFITGDAGIFLDPLYSPGMDYISLANSLITQLVTDSPADPTKAAERITFADNLFRTIAGLNFDAYAGQYKYLGNSEIMAIKLSWDTIVYHAFVVPGAFGGEAIEDPIMGFLPQIEADLARSTALNAAFRNLLADWYLLAGDEPRVGTATPCDDVMDAMQLEVLEKRDSEGDLVEHVGRYVRVLETIFAELVEAVAIGLGFEPPDGDAWMVDNEELQRFRITDLPKSGGQPATPATFSSPGGLYWAGQDYPEGVTNDHLAAWPGLGEGIHKEPKPVKYPVEVA